MSLIVMELLHPFVYCRLTDCVSFLKHRSCDHFWPSCCWLLIHRSCYLGPDPTDLPSSASHGKSCFGQLNPSLKGRLTG